MDDPFIIHKIPINSNKVKNYFIRNVIGLFLLQMIFFTTSNFILNSDDIIIHHNI